MSRHSFPNHARWTTGLQDGPSDLSNGLSWAWGVRGASATCVVGAGVSGASATCSAVFTLILRNFVDLGLSVIRGSSDSSAAVFSLGSTT